jgi:hypothetical protein
VLVGGRLVVGGGVGAFVVDVLAPVGVVVVVVPTGSVAGTLVADVLLVALVPFVTLVLLVTLVLVGRVPPGRVVDVVVVPDTTTGAGHSIGAGALRAANRPGLSWPILPPKSTQ